MNERDFLLKRFFPDPRPEPTYGLQIELIRYLPSGNDLRVEVRIDEIADLPTDEQIEAFRLMADQAFRKAFGPGPIDGRVQVIRNG